MENVNEVYKVEEEEQTPELDGREEEEAERPLGRQNILSVWPPLYNLSVTRRERERKIPQRPIVSEESLRKKKEITCRVKNQKNIYIPKLNKFE